MTFGGTPSVSRRQFVRAAAAGSAVLATGLPLLGSCGDGGTGPTAGSGRNLLPAPATMSPTGTLTAAVGTARVAAGLTAPALLINGSLPSPTIRARSGDLVQLQLINQLPEQTILHWHGLVVPADADGHPRDVIAPGAQYSYAFPVVQRAGTFWYHPHAHHNTAAQVHRGMAGFFLITDAEEAALDLPGGSREILLMLQDRDDPLASPYEYAPTASDLDAGMLRSVPYGNGVPLPVAYLPAARCRLRILNASHARVYRLALSHGAPLVVIGNDGGLLTAPVPTDTVWLGVGERVDCLVDLGALPGNARVMLRSEAFDVPRAAGVSAPQGIAMDLLELVRLPGDVPTAAALPGMLSTITPLPAPVRTRSFVFTSGSGDAMHRINGYSYTINRTDVEVPFGDTERWVFQNDSMHPHPVHLHGTRFQVESRVGGRGMVFDYERGWKDTVLLMPSETVSVLVRFDAYTGTYLLHCHNLQHEDMGMMLNVDVT